MTTKKNTTTLRRCAGSARFGIEPHEAPVSDFPKQPSRKDGLGTMCTPHWRAYLKGLNADRKARLAAGTEAAAEIEPSRSGKAARGDTSPKATTKRERRRTPMANKAAPRPESPRVRKARDALAAAEKLAGQAYTNAIAPDEVQAALETINGNDHGEQAAELEAIAIEAHPRSEEEIRALEE